MTELTPAGPARPGYVFKNAGQVNAMNLSDGYEIQNSYGQIPLVRVGGRWVSRDFDGDPFDDIGRNLNPGDWDGTFMITKEAS